MSQDIVINEIAWSVKAELMCEQKEWHMICLITGQLKRLVLN